MIPDPRFNIWEHSANVRDLYARRARGGEPEMDAAAQAAELLAPFITPGTTLLDAGCGSGYYWWSFKKRGLDVEYHGLDHSPTLIAIGREHLAAAGLAPERLMTRSIEEITETYDLVLCCNTLSFCPDFRRPLERLAFAARRALLIRTNIGPKTVYRWETDGYLDEGHNHLKAYWNQYAESEMTAFLREKGFRVTPITDRRTGGRMETVVGKPYYWKLLLAQRETA